MNTGSICRIGVFYDGSFFAYAQRYFYREKHIGWLMFQPLHTFFEDFLRREEPGYSSYKVVYSSWHQGLFTSKEANPEQLKFDRNLYHDLMHAGIEPKYVPMAQQGIEKEADVALAVDALQIGLDDKIDIAALVTGDGDFIPLVRALNKHGICVLVAYFNFTDSQGRKSYINERLRKCCNYSVDIVSLGENKEFRGSFKSLFRKQNGCLEPIAVKSSDSERESIFHLYRENN